MKFKEIAQILDTGLLNTRGSLVTNYPPRFLLEIMTWKLNIIITKLIPPK